MSDVSSLKEALRSVLKEVDVATRSDLTALDERVQKVEDEIRRLPTMVSAEVTRQLSRMGAGAAAGGPSSSGAAHFVPTTLMLRGWSTYGDPETQACADEMDTLWQTVVKKLVPPASTCLVPARPAVSNHQLLLRIRQAPLAPRLALQHARELRESVEAAVADVRFRGLPIRVGIELSPQRRERLRAFFAAQDELAAHLGRHGVEVAVTPCMQTLQLHGPRRHILGSFSSAGVWTWRPEAFASEAMGRPPGEAAAAEAPPS